MALLAEHVPKHRRKLVHLEGKPHIGGPLEDEILGLTDFGDAGQVALDVGREHRNAGARKSLGHHLQRDGLSGSGRAGDQPVPIGKRKRQPGRLFTLADKNLFNGIGGLDIGCRHYIAFVVHLKAQSTPLISASCKPIETFNERMRDGKHSSVGAHSARFRRYASSNSEQNSSVKVRNRHLLLHCCNTCGSESHRHGDGDRL